MVWFAARTHRSVTSVRRTGQVDRIRLTQAYLSAIAMGISNPLTIVLFFAASNAFVNKSAAPSLVAGVFLGSTAWWIILSMLVATARSRFDANTLALSSQLASFMFLLLGVFTLLRIAAKALFSI
jgi:threonine/homoserine/homoserine lactone efflux protein